MLPFSLLRLWEALLFFVAFTLPVASYSQVYATASTGSSCSMTGIAPYMF